MRRSRLTFGCLNPDQAAAFLPLPNEGDGEAPAAGAPDQTKSNSSAESEFPADTPLAQMTVEQREAYWRSLARKHEDRARKTDALAAWKQQNEAKVADYDRLLEASKTEHERALDAVKAETAESVRREVQSKLIRDLVHAEFRAAVKGAWDRDRVAKKLAPMDPNFFLTETGEVDVDKIATTAADWTSDTEARASDGQGPTGKPIRIDTGQGRRGAANASTSVQAGVELYQRMKNPQSAP